MDADRQREIETARDILASSGRLRAAINTGNAALVQRDAETGEIAGVSPALARAFGAYLGVPVELVIYAGAGKVLEAIDADTWDIAFLAIDPARAGRLAYSSPYVVIDSSFVVAASSGYRACADLDHSGSRILVAKGSAYDLHLTRTTLSAELIRAESPADSFAMFLHGGYAAVAGVRQSLAAAFATIPTVRLLPDAITSIDQAMAVSTRHAIATPALNAFLAARNVDGSMRAWLGT